MNAFRIFLALLGIASLTFGDPAAYQWQETESYHPPNFEEYFPDKAEDGETLDAIWKGRELDSLSDQEILDTVRYGLRCAKHRSDVLRWLGNRYIWNQSPQHPYAIEIMYHAADFSGERANPYGTRGNAVYFGLSVVKEKSPAILRTLTELCMRVDDPNDLHRVAWGAKSQQAELLPYLQPFLTADDEATREKAQVVEKIFKEELKAFVWATEQAKIRAEKEYTDQLPAFKSILERGSSEERKKLLKLMMRHRIVLIMDESFVPAFAACATDRDSYVRMEVARIVGEHWVWTQEEQDPHAINLMLRLSHDENHEVRHNAVYFGLSTVRDKDPLLVYRLLEMAFADRDPNLYNRVAWGLQRDRDTATQLLDRLLNHRDPQLAQHAREVYKDMTGKELPAE